MKANRIIPHPDQWKMVFGLTRFALLATLRNRASLFFSLVFPIIFISIFGLLGNATPKTTFGVAPEVDKNGAVYKVIKGIADDSNSPIELKEGSKDDLEKQLSQGKIDSVLEAADNGSLQLATSNASPQGKAESESIVNGIVSSMNFDAAKAAAGPNFKEPFQVSKKEISGKTYSYIDFALPGQIGFSLLSIATFGVAFPLLTLRKTLVLKRMFASGVKPLTFLVSQGISRTIQAVIQAAVIILVGVYAFKFNLSNGWTTFGEMLLLSAIAIASFLGFGVLIGNIAKDEQSLPIALNLFNLPQMLLSGVFFSTDAFPGWLQKIGNNLPLAYYNTALRKIAIEGAHIGSVWLYIVGMLAWSLAAYVAAAYTFKKE